MALQDKFDSALALVKEHNSVVGDGKPGYIQPEAFIQNLKIAGGTTEERLKGFSYEDILSCMTAANTNASIVKPTALAKDIAKLFRGKEETTSSEGKPISGKKADKMTLRELVEHYDPEEENAVTKRLKEISRGERFIVFSSGRSIDVDATFKLLQEVKQGFDGRRDYEVNGEIKEVHPIGSLPDNFVDENPLYKNRPLRPDGTCDQTGRSWEGVSTTIRQFVRIAMGTGEIDDINIDKAHSIIDMVVGDNALAKLRLRYRKAAIEFDKLQNIGNLPKLKLVLKKGAGTATRPFDGAKKVQWYTNTGYQMRLSDEDCLRMMGYNANLHKWKK